MGLNRFNDLPPRPDDLRKVRVALRRHQSVALATLISETGLTKTAVLCSLDELIRQGWAKKEGGAQRFALTSSDAEKDGPG